MNELNNAPVNSTFNAVDPLTGGPYYDFTVGDFEFKSHFPNMMLEFNQLKYMLDSQVGIMDLSEVEILFNNNPLSICLYSFTIMKDGNPYYDEETGTGNAPIVFSTVLDTIKKFVHRQHIDLIVFGGKDNNNKRSKLYRTIVRILQKRYHYECIEVREDNLSMFFVDLRSLKESTMKENSSESVMKLWDKMYKEYAPKSAMEWNNFVRGMSNIIREDLPTTNNGVNQNTSVPPQGIGMSANGRGVPPPVAPQVQPMTPLPPTSQPMLNTTGMTPNPTSVPVPLVDPNAPIGLGQTPLPVDFSAQGTSLGLQTQNGVPPSKNNGYNNLSTNHNSAKRTKRSMQEIDRAKQSTSNEDDEYKGLTKLEQAKLIIKDLKKKKTTDNNILFALVNRLFIDVETARMILNKEVEEKFPDKVDAITSEPQDGIYIEESKVICPKCGCSGKNIITEPKGKCKCKKCGNDFPINGSEEDTLNEDSIYNHSHITTSNNYDYGSYDFYQQRDPYEFELNSTQLVARAMLIDQRYTYEMRFDVINETSPRFPQSWRFLKFHNVNKVLKVSVNLLNASTNYMKLAPDSTYILNEEHITKIAGMAFKSYLKLWGKAHFQIIVITTENPGRLKFNQMLATELAKNSGIKINEDLSVEFTVKPTEHTSVSSKPIFYIVLTNSGGGSIKEDIVDEETNSTSFMANAPENVEGLVDLSTSKGHRKPIPFGGQTGSDINSDAKNHVNQMKKGLNAQLF